MEVQPRGYKKVIQLIDKGANIPNPSSLHIGDEVDLSRVSAKGLTIYPGCRIYGEKTAIAPGATLGAEGPVTIDDCALGPKVELKGGYFRQSVYLAEASVGPSAQVREGCLLEEYASVAHCVGLKQTILFPFVTVGSLVNFCDCLMAGGSGPTDHSEVGSSYVHFNFTPDGDKATPSLFGDVARGVMLREPAIFLGGQGGAVGPVTVNYGAVVAAGSILREDVDEECQLVCAPVPRAIKRERTAFTRKNVGHVVRSNVRYLANLAALEEWYRVVRHVFFAREEMGEILYGAALDTFTLAMRERANRLQGMVDRAAEAGAAEKRLSARVNEVCSMFGADRASNLGAEGEAFLASLLAASAESGGGYVQAIQSLDADVSSKGSQWMKTVVEGFRSEAETVLGLADSGDTDGSAG